MSMAENYVRQINMKMLMSCSCAVCPSVFYVLILFMVYEIKLHVEMETNLNSREFLEFIFPCVWSGCDVV